MARRALLKAINRSIILNVVKRYGPIARADIARLTKLSPATVTSQTAELIDDGLIYEKQEGDSRGGRPPILLALTTSAIYVIGVKLTEAHIVLALTDLNAEIVAQNTLALQSTEPTQVADLMVGAINELLQSANVPRKHLLGVGIGTAGIIDSANGVVRMSPHTHWRDVAFAEIVEERLGLAVYLDNNVNTLTLLERLYGLGQHVDNFLVITVGLGIGMGMVCNGKIYRGASGGGGEFGHTVVDPDGLRCSCGNMGCLETLVADPWLVYRAKQAKLNVETPNDLVKSAQGGDETALRIFRDAGLTLGQSVANLVNVFNPSMIIISGEGVRAGDFLFEPMRTAIRRHSFWKLDQEVDFRIEPLRDESWARGAASLVLKRVFETSETLTAAESG
ncbi:MAG TPA: ROK family transcriptional regulator [Phototrophicaceae bacterium]|nr:ROK family transcriptional regulator [Phototrophicaceae bacterium]